MIDRSHKLSIRRQAELLDISRGAVYYLPKPPSSADLAVMNAIDQLHLDFPFMGSRQLTRVLSRRGLTVGRLHVRTLMRKMGINRSNQVWAMDTTYIRMRKGFVYLTAVVDVFSRRILAHRTAITLEAIHAVEALQEAFNRFGTPEIVKTDQGSQFTAQDICFQC
jgi:putative transposase